MVIRLSRFRLGLVIWSHIDEGQYIDINAVVGNFRWMGEKERT